MEKEIKILTGEVQAIRTDRTSLEINGLWFQSKFNLIPVDINKGDTIKISFTENKGFNNIKKIEKINQVKPEISKTETKIDYKVNESRDSKEKIASMLLSYSKDIVVALIENKEQIYADLDNVLNHITDNLIKQYKKIKESL